MSPNRDFCDLYSAFNAEGVRYLLVGGYAFSFHAVPRFTKDLDVWVEATPESAPRVLRALIAFGAPAPRAAVRAVAVADAGDRALDAEIEAARPARPRRREEGRDERTGELGRDAAPRVVVLAPVALVAAGERAADVTDERRAAGGGRADPAPRVADVAVATVGVGGAGVAVALRARDRRARSAGWRLALPRDARPG